MNVQPDYEELLKLFNKYKVKYCIVGAYAVSFYVRPRYTKDMDILVEPSIENGLKILKALKMFGFKSLKLSTNDFTKEGQIIQLGYEPVRIDLLTSIDGCTFKAIWKHKKIGQYGKVKANFIGIKELIINKKETKRKQDSADLELLLKGKKKV